MKLRHALCTLEPKYKKKAKYATAESDLEDEWVAAHEDELEAKELEKAEKKFEKEKEKRAADGEPAQPRSELDARLATIREDAKRLRKERGTGKATLKRERPVEKLEEAIAKLEERIATAGLQMVDREEGKEVALTTSKINYLDPRITAGWCKEHDVPIEKLFSKTLLTKCTSRRLVCAAAALTDAPSPQSRGRCRLMQSGSFEDRLCRRRGRIAATYLHRSPPVYVELCARLFRVCTWSDVDARICGACAQLSLVPLPTAIASDERAAPVRESDELRRARRRVGRVRLGRRRAPDAPARRAHAREVRM
jgi:hypothetical protein